MKTRIRQGAAWIAEREPLAVLLLAPWLIFPSASLLLTIAALIALPFLWLARWVAGRPVSIRTPLNWPLLLLLITLAPAVLVSPRPDLSLPKATTFLLGTGVFFALVNCDRRWRRPDVGAAAITIAGAAAAGLALLGTNWVEGKILFLERYTSRLPSGIALLLGGGFEASVVGGAMALLLPVAASYALLCWRQGRRPFMDHRRVWAIGAAAAAALMLVVMLLSQSRTAVLITLLIGGMLTSGRSHSIRLVMASLGIAAGVLLLIGLLTGSLGDWLVTLDAIGQDARYPPTSWLGRVEIWRVAWRVLQDYPAAGTGLHAFGPAAWLNYGLDIIGPEVPLTHAHNLWLQAAADHGLIGLLAFLWLTVVLAALGWAVQRGRPSDEGTLLLGFWLGLVAWMGHGLLNAVSLGAGPALAVWGMMGLLVATWEREPRLAVEYRRPAWLSPVAAAVLFVLAAGLLSSPFRPLNRGANLLDRALLSDEPELLSQALEHLDAAGDLPGTLRRKALARYEMGHQAQAILLFGQDPEAERYLVSRGRLLMEDGDLAEAREFILMALEVVPDSGRLACLAGDAYRLDHKPHDAVTYYRMIAQREPSFGEDAPRLARCYYELGMLEKEWAWWGQAAGHLGLAAALDPVEILYPTEHGWALYQSTGELSQAVAAEEAALALDPEAVDVMVLLADIYLQADRPLRAVEWSEKAAAVAPSDPRPWLRLALGNWELQEWELVEQAVEEVLRLDPENERALVLQAELESE